MRLGLCGTRIPFPRQTCALVAGHSGTCSHILQPPGVQRRPALEAAAVAAAALAAKRRRQRGVSISRRHNTFSDEVLLRDQDDRLGSEEQWGERFNWKKAWYPLALLAENLDPSRPNKLELLGEDLVAWMDGTGTWRVFEDHCPHRSVPLSEGRIEADGTLMCSYHGWRFSGDGKVTTMPQAHDKDLARLLQNKRACAASRPAQVKEGILWVWGETSPDAALESSLVEPNLPEELYDPQVNGRVCSYAYPWGMRDLPYGWDVALENVTDPAHVAVAHHNTLSNRYVDPCPIEIKWIRKPTNSSGFKFQFRSLWKTAEKMEEAMVSTMEFRPPSYHRVTTALPNGASLIVTNNFVPTKPGRARQISAKMLMTGVNGEKPPANALGYRISAKSVPDWLRHILQPIFVHQDLVFVHHQQAILQNKSRKTGATWKQAYWIPCEADKSTVALRTWLDRTGGIDWSPAVPTDLPVIADKQRLFDTYLAHTEKCATCREALKKVSRLQMALTYSAIGLGFAGISRVSCQLLVGGTVLGLAAGALSRVKAMFYRYPFNHQDNK